MVKIYSHNTSEFTTEIIMDWISHFGYESERINGIDIINRKKFEINIANSRDLIDFEQYEHDNISWFRRWIDPHSLKKNIEETDIFFEEDVISFVKSELRGLTDAFFYTSVDNWYEKPPYLNNSPTKIKQLEIAKKLKLSIPATIITNNKESVRKFVVDNNNKQIIIKPIREISLFGGKDSKFYVPYTSEVHLDQIPDLFFPSLFQTNIKKEFEARVFYFDKKCYSMAIFSKLDEQTKEDFRKYNWDKPNRNVPLKLGIDIEKKIVEFMEYFKLKSGSLDFLYNSQDGFVFLEVNPGGQFGMVSYPCNYFLEKIIAKKLIELSTKISDDKNK